VEVKGKVIERRLEEPMTTLHDVPRAAVSRATHIRLPSCPLCGDMLLAPMMAEHVTERLVHNHWACESCGYTFRKSFDYRREDRAFICET
jgi:ribosomal protein S27AE